MSLYRRKIERKVVFFEENLIEIKRKIEAGQSKRSIAKKIGISEWTLRRR